MMLEAFNTPWKVTNRIHSWIDFPLVRIQFALNGIAWGKGWRFYGIPMIQKHRLSSMTFGAELQLRSSLASNPLGLNHPVILATLHANSRLRIGDRFAMTGGTLCVADCIEIGNDVNIGANSGVIDTDFHPLSAELRIAHPQDGKTKPVVIEDNVFIGGNCIVLKGVTIGQGSVVGAGSVVTRCVPRGVIVAGNPARVIREI
jgi:acetyltransferase-like isoleucine patch superfamily enzyme